MPIQYPGNAISKAARAKDGGGFESAVEVVPPADFTPFFKEDMSSLSVGSGYPSWTKSTVSNTQSKSGTKSVAISPAQTEVGSCPVAASKVFAGYTSVPDSVPVGATVWYRAFFYFPSTFSFGYLWSTADDAEANACGYTNNDGNGLLKFLVLDPAGSNARLYLNISSNKREVAQPASAVFELISETDTPGVDGAFKIPTDQWVSIQLAAKLTTDTTGWMRAWADDQLIVERLNTQTLAAAATGLASFGVGNIWNGFPFTDGAAGRDTFYMDEVMVATDIDGYGAPTGTDANGNAYIPSTVLAGDF